MFKEIRFDLFKIIICIVLFLISLFIEHPQIHFMILLIAYIIISYEMYIKSFRHILKGIIFDENLLMILSTLGAFYIGSYLEALLVMLLFQIGELLSDFIVDRSKKSITELMNLRADMANLELEGGEVKTVKVEKVQLGDIIVIRPGEIVPLDGEIVEGSTYLDMTSLTGESVPKKVKAGEDVLSGSINRDGFIKVKTTSTSRNSTAQKIIDLIENSENRKSHTETFIQKFASIYTPFVCLCSLLLIIIPTLFGGSFQVWFYRGLIFLVTSCPCALVISVPLGYFCGVGKASREGILVKGFRELEFLSDLKYLMFDKTGTITEGVFEISEIHTDMDQMEFLKLIVSAEENSNHPVGDAIKKNYVGPLVKTTNFQEIPGEGISCEIDGKLVLVGNAKLLHYYEISFEPVTTNGTIVYLAYDHEYCGYVVIADRIKKNSKKYLAQLHELVPQDMIILSGDNEKITKDVARKVGISKYYGNLLPIDKVAIVREFQKEGHVMFIGDGINDAPVIRFADIGISMGSIGSDAAIEASDVIIMQDDLSRIRTAILISLYTKKKIMQSVIFALVVKFFVLILSAFGLSTMLLAVFADVGVTLLVILNVITIFMKKFE